MRKKKKPFEKCKKMSWELCHSKANEKRKRKKKHDNSNRNNDIDENNNNAYMVVSPQFEILAFSPDFIRTVTRARFIFGEFSCIADACVYVCVHQIGFRIDVFAVFSLLSFFHSLFLFHSSSWTLLLLCALFKFRTVFYLFFFFFFFGSCCCWLTFLTVVLCILDYCQN